MKAGKKLRPIEERTGRAVSILESLGYGLYRCGCKEHGTKWFEVREKKGRRPELARLIGSHGWEMQDNEGRNTFGLCVESIEGVEDLLLYYYEFRAAGELGPVPPKSVTFNAEERAKEASA